MIDIPAVKLALGLRGELNQSDIEELVSCAKMKSFPANEVIIKYGSMKKNLYFILKGLVRTYFIDDKGTDKTRGISPENAFFLSPQTILQNKPSIYYIETLEPTDVLYMNYDELQAIVSKNPNLSINRKHLYEHLIVTMEYHLHSFIVKTSEERYLDFIKTYPNISQRVPNKYIASFLGFTPVQLSRIRKKIATKK